jgi:transcriptional regulator with XRE-family HTH domain
VNVAERFGENLMIYRKRAGLSQEELGFRASLHRTEISQLERGVRLARIDTLVKLAGALSRATRRLAQRDGMEFGINASRPLPGFPMSEGYDEGMAKQSKKPADLNRLAAAIVGEATNETPPEPESQQMRAGRAGGRKGGRARAERLSPEERSKIARAAAKARWER